MWASNDEMVKICESFSRVMNGMGWFGLSRRFDKAANHFRYGERGPGFQVYRQARLEISERGGWSQIVAYLNEADGDDAA